MIKPFIPVLFIGLLAAALTGCTTQKCCSTDAKPYFTNWPAGASPAEVGKRVAENVAARKFDFEANPKRKFVIYPEAIAWYGALTVAQLTGDTNLQSRLIHRYDYFLTPEGATHISTNAHVDYRVFGIVPMEIYLQTKDPKYLAPGKDLADRQWASTTPDGISTEARYWVDDMYMLPAVQVQAYRATHDKKYLDRAALTMAAYLDKLQQTNGLFFHAPDSPFCWGRGNGWFAAGMAELLSDLPPDHPQYARIMKGYQAMMAALLKYQGGDGLWRQLIDHPEAWPESSGTGMFTFAMITGVKHGWLDARTYGPAARKGWLGLVAHLDPDANVTDICIGTNKGFLEAGTDLEKQLQFYLARPRKSGDLHGQAPLLWCATALLR